MVGAAVPRRNFQIKTRVDKNFKPLFYLLSLAERSFSLSGSRNGQNEQISAKATNSQHSVNHCAITKAKEQQREMGKANQRRRGKQFRRSKAKKKRT